VKYGAVVFDLWNTLVVWPGNDGRDFYGEMADHVGVQRDLFDEAWTVAYDERAVGPLEPSVRTVCKQLELDDDHVDRLISFRIEFTREALVPREGAVRVLEELSGLGLRTGLISVCSEEVPRLWNETRLSPLIDVAVFSCSVGVKKPERRIYEIAAERLGLSPQSCLFVDDQPEFVAGAVAAGMDGVLIDSPPGAPPPAGLDGWEGRRVSSLEEVLELAQ
jgi:putative hydrolase of the HAD superfamily